MTKREYRIVTDRYAGYEVQHRSKLWPFWQQTNGINTHPSLEKAERFADKHSRGCADLVKYIGWLPKDDA